MIYVPYIHVCKYLCLCVVEPAVNSSVAVGYRHTDSVTNGDAPYVTLDSTMSWIVISIMWYYL